MGLFDVISSGINAWSNQKAIDKQNKANMDLAKYQTQVQEELYNKYSSPSALMRQFKEAGLNPNLVYGNAAAGQGNVPSYSAPHIERGLSVSEKFNTALSALSQIMGLRTQTYQVDAAREAAEQSALKTLNDAIQYRRNARDYAQENLVSGYQEQTLWKRLFRKRRGNVTQADVEGIYGDGWNDNPAYTQYIEAARHKFFNDARRSGVQNRLDNARAYAQETENQFLPHYYELRNDQAQLDYDIDKEFKQATSFTDIGVKWLQPILSALTALIRGRRK